MKARADVRWLALVCLAGCATMPEQGASTIREVSSRDTAPPSGRSEGQVSLMGCGALSWPVEAQVSSGFGPREARPHLGIDLVVPEGVPVLAACDGVVTYADDKLRGYGRLVVVEHADGLSTAYAHNERLLVSAGTRVGRGQPLALSGQTGRVTAPHVHFEVRERGQAVDPLPRMESRLHLTSR